MELISREEVMRLVESGKLLSGSFGERAKDIIESIPTIEERKEGKLIKRDRWLYCSACDDGGWGLGAVTYGWQYCPSCGAKIKGE